MNIRVNCGMQPRNPVSGGSATKKPCNKETRFLGVNIRVNGEIQPRNPVSGVLQPRNPVSGVRLMHPPFDRLIPAIAHLLNTYRD
ncbi:hypothetical protein [Planktothricoides raciborskii]|uniref:Uncharacterized protein n=1 Tax=Planktothricoides raciborskii FACHB-1370 TaxID=2949576 RepID=A0ABR8E9K7_9CYAN|nr:hypothetical protein [Planktothricoides raciborskii]MBD2542849.1 hypothetical protein [Planktothricoides raciborskii FACHB-1370]MBD2581404.1 hypothetical protein [Planktothricoides raciborskii FACHB-1261]